MGAVENTHVELLKQYLEGSYNPSIPNFGIDYTYILEPKNLLGNKLIPRKIGRGWRPNDRLKALSKDFNTEFQFNKFYLNADDVKFETYLHSKFKDKNITDPHELYKLIGQKFIKKPSGVTEFFLLDEHDLKSIPEIYHEEYLKTYPTLTERSTNKKFELSELLQLTGKVGKIIKSIPIQEIYTPEPIQLPEVKIVAEPEYVKELREHKIKITKLQNENNRLTDAIRLHDDVVDGLQKSIETYKKQAKQYEIHYPFINSKVVMEFVYSSSSIDYRYTVYQKKLGGGEGWLFRACFQSDRELIKYLNVQSGGNW
jgi:hypothetical protein